MEQPDLTTDGLRDASLVLRLGHQVVGNDVDAQARTLVVITGANQGGKSTLLRGVGLALLMMQSGMLRIATSFQASVSKGVFTHFKREEDTAMTSGKLDEELGRMSEIVDHLRPGDTVLLNESFAATNEREGSAHRSMTSRTNGQIDSARRIGAQPPGRLRCTFGTARQRCSVAGRSLISC